MVMPMFIKITDKFHSGVDDMVVNINDIEKVYPSKIESFVNPETGETEDTPLLLGVTYKLKLRGNDTEYVLTKFEYDNIVARIDEFNATHLDELKSISEELRDVEIPYDRGNGVITIDVYLKYDNRSYPVAINVDDIMSMNANFIENEFTITTNKRENSPFISSFTGFETLIIDMFDFYKVMKIKERRNGERS